MQKKLFPPGYSAVLPDLVVILLLFTVIYGLAATGSEWQADYQPVTQIDLSVWALPYYTLLSAIRGSVAYLISLGFTLIVGYAAARSKTAERVILPMLDILQSVPVLAFLPGLLLGLVALFPRSNFGLELAAILMIFTGQVWNMTFSFYNSLKSIPEDFKEAYTLIALSKKDQLIHVELPFSAMNLAWNSLLSMAGGWFFLIPCEAMTLGDNEYRLPGIGAYMDVAIKQGDTVAILCAAGAMITLIVLMDFVIWRPILSWVRRFRLEDVEGVQPPEPLMQIWMRESKIVRWLKGHLRDFLHHHRVRLKQFSEKFSGAFRWIFSRIPTVGKGNKPVWLVALRIFNIALLVIFLGLILWGGVMLFCILQKLAFSKWMMLLRDTLWTFLRIVLALGLSTLWAVPFGIWLGTSSKRIRIAQPLIQIFASFPAPMIYPLVISILLALRIEFEVGSGILILLGVQWYVLFNVLAGALRIPRELNDALRLMETSRWDRWKTLYLPSVFPHLVTGWITATGGAWNASVVAEYMPYKGKILKTAGLGADLSVATTSGDFTLFAGSLVVMIFTIIVLNRVFWSRIYLLAQTRYRMD